MITEITLQKLHDERVANPGSAKVEDIERMFVDGQFNDDNWNGGDAGLIRKVINAFKDREKYFKNTNIFDDQDTYDDTDYIIMNVDKYGEDTHATFLTGKNEVYIFRYYKDRGKTEFAVKDGHPMTETEYLVLLNLLERYGYDFGIYEMKL